MCLGPRFFGLLATTLAFFTAAASVASGADLAQLKAALQAGAPAEQHAAADDLADLGAKATPAVPDLAAALKSSDAELRWRAARALGVIGDPQATAALRTAASDGDVLVRAQAIFALGRLKAGDAESLQAVVAHLSDEDPQVRRATIRAVRMMGPPQQTMIPLVVKLLGDSDPTIAARALSAITDGGVEVLPALTAALDQHDARYWACLALGEMGPQAQTAVPGLIKALDDDRPEVRLQAAIALGEIGPDAKPAASSITKLMNDAFPSVRAAAIFALGRIGEPSTAGALASAETSTDPFVKMLATWALAKLNPKDQQRLNKAVDALVTGLGDKNRDVAHLAAKALEDLKPGTDLLRPLIDKLITTRPEAADRVLGAVSSLGVGAVPHAIAALKDPQRRVRGLQVLGRIGPESAPAVPALVELLKSGDEATKTEVLYSLGAIGPGAQAAASAISEHLAENDPRVAQAAAIALGKIGPGAKEAIPALAKLNQSKDELLRLTSVWAILKIGAPSADLTKTAIPILSTALQSDREFVRIEAATTLGELGRGAASALPALQTAANDASPAVRSAAASAITKIK
jgi:HEAT repeat protein